MRRRLYHGLRQTIVIAAMTVGLSCAVLIVNAYAAAQVQITNISDINMGSWGLGDPSLSAHIDLCIGSLSNAPAGGYAITAAGSNGFMLQNGSQQIPYSLSWDDGGAGNLGSSNAALTNNGKLSGQVNANTSSSICLLGSPTARLTIKIAATDLTAALAGTYNGTITLTLSPN